MYGKIFASMYEGSIYGKWQAIVTFQQLIALADKNGVVDMTAQSLSARTSIPLEIIEKGIQDLESPDPVSRTPDEEGRRIVRLDDHRPWGWVITNYKKYRDIRTAEERREYHRQYWHKRKKNKESQPDSTNTQQNQPIVEVEVEVDTSKTLMSGKPDAIELLTYLNKKANKNYQPVDTTINKIIARLKEYSPEQLRRVIENKCNEWGNDEKMNKYLRPATLFNAEKCAQYVGENSNKPQQWGKEL